MSRYVKTRLPIILIWLITIGLFTFLSRDSQGKWISYGFWLIGIAPLIIIIVFRKKIHHVGFWGPLSFVVFLILLECGLSVGYYKYRFLPNDVGKNFVPHNYLLWVPKADDSKGADSPLAPLAKYNEKKDEGSYRILILGGSNAAGAGISDREQTFARILEKQLGESYFPMKVEIINAGTHGYNLFQNLVNYKMVLRKYSPDLVIFYGNINDSTIKKSLKTYREMFYDSVGVDISRFGIDVEAIPEKTFSAKKPLLDLHSFKVYNLLAGFIVPMRKKTPAYQLEKEMNSLEDYEKNLHDLIQIVKKDGANLILVDAFFYCVLAPPSKESKRIDLIRRTMETKANNEPGVYFLPAHKILAMEKEPKKLVFYPEDFYHLNEKGHEKVANLLYELVQERGLIDQAR